MKVYEVPRLSEPDEVLSIPRAFLDEALWGTAYRPRSEAAVGWMPDALEVLLASWEDRPRTVETTANAEVYQDSCLEFFLMPFPDISRVYLNFEFNSRGTLLLGSGGARTDRIRLPESEGSLFAVRPIRLDAGRAWGMRFRIPFVFLQHRFGPHGMPAGHVFCGNFQKCGDLCETPHYLAWNPILAETPDFHRPGCFGMLRLAIE